MWSSLLSFSMPVHPGAHNTHRPHRSLEQQPPLVEADPVSGHDHEWRVHRRDLLGGLLHEYELAA